MAKKVDFKTQNALDIYFILYQPNVIDPHFGNIYVIEIFKLLIASQCFRTSSNAAAAAMVAAWSSSSVVFPKGWHHRDTVMTNYNDILEHFNVMKS